MMTLRDVAFAIGATALLVIVGKLVFRSPPPSGSATNLGTAASRVEIGARSRRGVPAHGLRRVV
jgi:hypothetical protein